MKNTYKTYGLGALAVIILILAALVYNSIVYKTQISEFEVKASTADAAGISPESHFLVKTTVALSPVVLEKYIKISPETPLTIKKTATENTYEIIPRQKFAENKIYTVSIAKGPIASHTFSWAYQVKAPFQVVSSIPGEKTTDVPVNTGIEIDFNREGLVHPEQFITVSPEVAGVFEVEGTKVRFIPKKPLQPRSIYNVTIHKGLSVENSTDTFGEEKTISFETTQLYQSTTQPSVNFSRRFSEYKPGQQIFLGIQSYNAQQVAMTVYRFNSLEEYLTAIKKVEGGNPWAHYAIDIEAALAHNEKVFNGRLPLIEKDGYASQIQIPQALPVGFYAAFTDSGNNKDISWFQVHPDASFLAVDSKQSLVWLKDIDKGSGVANVPIFFNTTQVGVTGADGVALFTTPKELVDQGNTSYESQDRKFYVARVSSGALLIPLENEYGYAATLSDTDHWWNYISFNKNIYLPTDTLHFWAIAKPRQGNLSAEEMTVRITNTYWRSSDEKDLTTYAETKVTPSEYGSLTGELSFANLRPGVYELSIHKGKEIVAQKTVTVASYKKPAYTIELTPSRNSLFVGESATVKVKAHFFDGTPVPNTSLVYSAYDVDEKQIKGQLVLNDAGEGSFTITPTYSEKVSCPSYITISVRPEKAEEGQIEANTSLFVFGPRIYNSITQTQSPTEATFTIKTQSVVVDTLRGEPYWSTNDYLGTAVPDTLTHVDVAEVVYHTEQTGTGYDQINKVTYPQYTYRTENRPISSQNIAGDQNGLAHFVFPTEKDKTYLFTFVTSDTNGRPVKDTRYVYGGYGDTIASADTSYYLHNLEIKSGYKIGDRFNLQLQTSEGVTPTPAKEKYIFITVHNGDIEYVVQDSPKYTATFRSQDVPNVGVWTSWFADGRFQNDNVENISFDSEERRLHIEVMKNKPTYKPGEHVSLDVRVTDKNHRPVQAEVNLSALDEAVFSVRPDEQDVISELYRDIYSQLVIRTSNKPPYGGGGAERGGGGDGNEPRGNIQEIALYKTVTTDAQGLAHVEFKLPDNITSWRLTSQALTKDFFAGKQIDFIPVSLPFFVDATLNTTYLAGDELMLRLRTYGPQAGQGSTRFTLISPTLPFKKLEYNGPASVEVPIGALPSGLHTITIRAATDKAVDAITRGIHVVDSYFTKTVSDFYEGTPTLKITHKVPGYTTLVLSSYGRGQVYDKLKSLSYEGGVRLDQYGSQLIAARLLSKYFGEKSETQVPSIDRYQSSSGGMQLLPYSSEDVELSAIAAHLLDASLVNRSALDSYLSQSLTDSKADLSRIVRALYGMTAFNEPVLTKIEKVTNDSALTTKDKVFVALALDAIGAKEEARSYYREKIKPGFKMDESIQTTALAAALAANLEEPEAALYYRYVTEHPPKDTLTNFEQLLYLTTVLPKLDPADVSFSYAALTKTDTKALKNGETFTLTLSPEELAAFSLSNIKGKLGVTTIYEELSSPASIVKDPNLSISRTYNINGAPTKELKEGDIVAVMLTPKFAKKAIDGLYQIVDYLPSGLRALSQVGDGSYSNYGSYPVEVNDQKVTFVTSKQDRPSLYYYARVVSKGSYKAEPALLQSITNLSSATISNEDRVTIK